MIVVASRFLQAYGPSIQLVITNSGRPEMVCELLMRNGIHELDQWGFNIEITAVKSNNRIKVSPALLDPQGEVLPLTLLNFHAPFSEWRFSDHGLELLDVVLI